MLFALSFPAPSFHTGSSGCRFRVAINRKTSHRNFAEINSGLRISLQQTEFIYLQMDKFIFIEKQDGFSAQRQVQ